MKQEEKTRRTCEKIMAAALKEFGTKSYDSASLTTLCNENQISKGLIYHNFKNKDELYLQCVEKCFEEMTVCLKSRECRAESTKERLQNLFWLRQQFFEKNPYYCNIFFHAVLQPPQHLREEIKILRQEYDLFHINYFQDMLRQMQLRTGITIEAATEYFMMFLEMYNGYFKDKTAQENDIHALMENHEVNLSKILDFMLYGVAKENE